MFFKTSVLKNVPIFTKKTPVLESLFNKVVNIAKFLKTDFFIEHLRLLLNFAERWLRVEKSVTFEPHFIISRLINQFQSIVAFHIETS